MKEKIIFFGSGKYVLPVIEILSNAFDLDHVVTTEQNTNDPVINFCNKMGINTLSVSSLKDFDKKINQEYKVAVLASFGLIIPDSVLNMFPFGIVNIHPSLLPKFRGPTPVQTAIADGANKTGVTIIKLDSEVDHGPIIAAADYPIGETDTAESLYKILFKLGADLLVDALPKYLSGALTPEEQNHGDATFTESLTRESGFINIEKPTSKEKLLRMIRAYFPWPGVWFKTKLNDNEKIIKLFPEEKIQVEGKKVMSFKDFANGYSEGNKILTELNLR